MKDTRQSNNHLHIVMSVNIQQAIKEARSGKFSPIHLFVGTERFLIDRAVTLIRQAAVGERHDPFNEEVFYAKSMPSERVIDAVRTLPMMAQTRYVLVRGIDDWKAEDLERLEGYFQDPSDMSCLVLTAEKLDGRTRFARTAKKEGYWTDAAPLKSPDLRKFANAEAKRRGHELDPEAANWLVDAIGNDLAAIDDAIERLSLFVGSGAKINIQAVETTISRIRIDTIWALVDAVGMRNRSAALHAASSLLSNREPPLRILFMIARQLRIIARMRHALSEGKSVPDATREAGAPPFKARELVTSAKRFNNAELSSAFRVIAKTDMALKSSRCPPEVLLQGAIAELSKER